MINRDVEIINKLGLHARAASKFVKTATGFDSEITVRKGNRSANGKSIMGVMMLAASRGSVLELTANGADEGQAVAALEKLIKERFGEAE
jgi:phosphocarrier protein HPr